MLPVRYSSVYQVKRLELTYEENTMRLNLNASEIQTILNALENETIHHAVTLRAKLWEQVKKDSKKLGDK